MICGGTGQYSVTGSVIFEDGANTGDCPACHVRVPLDLDGIVLGHETPCGAPMTHAAGDWPAETVGHCTLPKGHQVQIEDSDHYDEHGCLAPVLVHQSTLREVAHVANEYPDGIHTCAELQQLEPGRRSCTCGRCP